MKDITKMALLWIGVLLTFWIVSYFYGVRPKRYENECLDLGGKWKKVGLSGQGVEVYSCLDEEGRIITSVN